MAVIKYYKLNLYWNRLYLFIRLNLWMDTRGVICMPHPMDEPGNGFYVANYREVNSRLNNTASLKCICII